MFCGFLILKRVEIRKCYNFESIEEITMAKKKTYTERKEMARNDAINWQSDFAMNVYSWGELAFWADHFERLGKRYGLLREFRENGIC